VEQKALPTPSEMRSKRELLSVKPRRRQDQAAWGSLAVIGQACRLRTRKRQWKIFFESKQTSPIWALQYFQNCLPRFVG
jgi:hypothetical protein